MINEFDHILLIGFGGPEKNDDIMPFLHRVTAGRNISDDRLQSVAHHYKLLGGKSPYNAWASQLQTNLSNSLKKNSCSLPIFLGYRNTAPFFKDTLSKIQGLGLKKGLGIILAPFRGIASCRRYKENITEALKEASITGLHYFYLPPWHSHPDFIRLLANLTQSALKQIPKTFHEKMDIYFSCHSIPTPSDTACSHCCYSEEFETTSLLTAAAAKISKWKYVYQSRSGDPSQPWLEPNILETLKKSASEGVQSVLIIPMGFLSDNAEVLYDLDIEAKNRAEDLGISFFRAPTPGNSSALVELFSSLAVENIKNPESIPSCVH